MKKLSIFIVVVLGLTGCAHQMNDTTPQSSKNSYENTALPLKPIVIAHRGASGYLPEHTLPAAAMAYGMGADYIEPDVVLTKDSIPIVLHDIHLEPTTNVREVFPDRHRDDGHWYAIDFTLAEIKQLHVNERIDFQQHKAVFDKRFPLHQGRFEIPTLAEEIELVQGLNKSTGKDVGIYPELKKPAFHEAEGYRMGQIILDELAKYAYIGANARVFVQCFDPDYLKSLRHELKTDLPLIQLIGPNEWEESLADYDQMMTKEGLSTIASYANGIGIWTNQIKDEQKNGQRYVVNPNLVKDAHAAGLKVHVYTFREDALPDYVGSFDELHDVFLKQEGVDGVFTDFTDKTVKFVNG